MNFIVEWHERLASTSTFLRERAKSDQALEEGLVVAAHEQTQGRGRSERIWISRPGENLTFSILLRPGADARKMVSLPMAAALAVADVLGRHGVRAQLKWPNDVLADDRKICGILTDSLAEGAVILGIGINVNMTEETVAQIGQPATSIRIVTGKKLELPELLEVFLAAFSVRYRNWLSGGFSSLRRDWETAAQQAGTTTARGRIAGYGECGELLIRRGDGRINAVWSD